MIIRWLFNKKNKINSNELRFKWCDKVYWIFKKIKQENY